MLSKSGNFGPHLSLCSNICRTERRRGGINRETSLVIIYFMKTEDGGEEKVSRDENIIGLLITPHTTSLLPTPSNDIR